MVQLIWKNNLGLLSNLHKRLPYNWGNGHLRYLPKYNKSTYLYQDLKIKFIEALFVTAQTSNSLPVVHHRWTNCGISTILQQNGMN
jgi:hypothetical protein